MTEHRSAWMDDELEMFRDAARRFVENEIVPNDPRWREQHHVDRDLWNKAGEVGLLCTDIPDQYGGVGGDARHEAVVVEEMGRRGITSFGHMVHSILAHYVLNYGTEEQKLDWLPRMASGELVGAIAMTEPGAGSDLQAVKCRAVREGDDYVLNGAKTFISNGLHAGLVGVVAKTDPAKGAQGHFDHHGRDEGPARAIAWAACSTRSGRTAGTRPRCSSTTAACRPAACSGPPRGRASSS